MQDLSKLPDPLLDDVQAVGAMTGFSTATIYRLLRDDPTFPRPRQLGRRMTRWVRSEVVDWVASRPAAR
jgi:predicted DNA-binding transcriptional regulator AlpA